MSILIETSAPVERIHTISGLSDEQFAEIVYSLGALAGGDFDMYDKLSNYMDDQKIADYDGPEDNDE